MSCDPPSWAWHKTLATGMISLAALAGLYIVSVINYLLFYSLVEGFGIVVAACVFLLSWNSRRYLDSDYLLFLGISCAFIAVMDFAHTLGYWGTSVFPECGSDLPAQLRIAARYLESASLLAAPLFFRRKLNPYRAMLAYTAVTEILLAAILCWDVFPACVVDGEGLTRFKQVSEYAIALILLGSLALLYRERTRLDRTVFRFIAASILLTIASELSFTFSLSLSGPSNMTGHLLKVLSFYLIYRAIIETGLTKPFSLLLRDLKQKDVALARSHRDLEKRVEQRTAELAESNEMLRNEMVQRERAEAVGRDMEVQLRQQQKLEAIGLLAGGIAHEVNNPINGIMNYAQLIKDAVGEDSVTVANYTTEIIHETERVAALVRDLLAFARQDKQSHSPARVIDIVDGTLSLIRTVIRSDQITLDVEVPEDLPKVICRSQQIQQVLMNLMTNARDALNDRYQGYDGDKRMAVTARQIEKEGMRWIRITVEDHGPGIPPNIQKRMFDPFFTSKPRERGTGLGLSISHGIAKEHGGHLTFEAEPGEFTRFHVDLPLPPTAA